MRHFMEAAGEFDFATVLTKLLGINEEKVKEIVENLGVDELTDLIDACMKEDKTKIREIVGAEKMEADEPAEDGTKDDDIGALLLPKDKAKKLKAKKRELRRRKEELGEDDDAAATSYTVGDPVWVGEDEGTVKIPSGPSDTVGVMINGELKMVDKKDVEKLEEGVLGMTAMPGLQRMMELAGLPMPNVVKSEEPPAPAFDEPPPPPEMTDAPLAPEMDAVPTGDEFGGAMNDDEFGGAMHDDSMRGADITGGDAPIPAPAPGTPSLPAPAMDEPAMDVPPAPMGVGGIPQLGTALEDAAALDQAISDIEGMIPNVKISDYKTVVARLEALVALAKSTGKSALAEARAMKAAPAPKVVTIKKDNTKPFTKPVAVKAVKEAEEKEVDEDSLDTDGDNKADAPKKDDKTDRKTLMDYVREAEEAEIGNNNAEAVKNVQAKLGKDATPQQAQQTMNKLRSKGLVKQKGSTVTMDADIAAALGDEETK